MNYNDYYGRQAGGALPFFVARMQLGQRLGSLFGGLLRSAMPLFKRRTVVLRMRALKTAMHIAEDVMSGQNIKQVANRRAMDADKDMIRTCNRRNDV